jgi:hypothetical protein
LLVILASFYYDGTLGGQQTPSDVFIQVRWLAVGLTAIAAVLLAMSLNQFAGRRSLLQGKYAAIVALVVAAVLITMLVRTVVV